MHPLGISFTAVILRPPTTSFCIGEVVIGKIINEHGDLRIRPFHAKSSLECIDLSSEYQSCLEIIPPIETSPPALDTSVFDRKRRSKIAYRFTANIRSIP